jgi:uncharacterized repeat protein (TIGR01451 family)
MESLARRKYVLLTIAALAVALTIVLGLRAADSSDPPAAIEAASSGPGETPTLELKINGPEKALVDSKVTFDLIVTNIGRSPARNLLLIDRFEPGLQHSAAESPIEHDLDELAPGKSQRTSLTFRVTRPGLLAHTAQITSGGKLVTSQRAALRAVGKEENPPSTVPGGDERSTPKPEPKPEPKSMPGSAFPEIPYKPDSSVEDEKEKVPKLGEPLADKPEDLTRLQADQPIWIDRKNGRVVVIGGVCLRQAPLELFACLRGSKEHESILTVPTKASFVHFALLLIDAKPGGTVQYEPKYVPARGTEIEITLAWKDEKGQRQTARAQDWVRDFKTKKAMQHPWVFAGSRFLNNPQTGQNVYQADREGDLVCVSNFPDAVLDLPIASSSANEELLFEAFTERIPRIGTPVTMILTPKGKKGAEPEAKPTQPAKVPENAAKPNQDASAKEPEPARPSEKAPLARERTPAGNSPGERK